MESQRRKPRTPREAVVAGRERLTRDLVRVHFEGPGVDSLPPLDHTDSYVKLLFPPAGADYAWPFDPEVERARRPREQWPVTRTYTIRRLDGGRMSIDFVVHGGAGIAGPWAAAAEPGMRIGFLGPGGGWGPVPGADHHVLVGDEAAAPAIAAALDALPHGAHATAVVEVADESAHIPLRVLPNLDLHWVHRDATGEPHGVALARAARDVGLPEGDVRVFVHGNAGMIKDLRRFYFVELGLPREHVSISGYWRSGQTEDTWQATKKEFVEQMERDERAWAVSQGR